MDGKKIPYDDQLAWPAIATLSGLPATVAPIGHDDSGLPIGVQIIGGYLEDRTTIAFAGLIEREIRRIHATAKPLTRVEWQGSSKRRWFGSLGSAVCQSSSR